MGKCEFGPTAQKSSKAEVTTASLNFFAAVDQRCKARSLSPVNSLREPTSGNCE